MNPKKIWSNLAVSDLDRTTKFYTQLGFTPNGKPSNELTSFLFGDTNFVMHFFLKDILEVNVKAEIADSHKVNEIVFTLSADSKGQVNKWAKEGSSWRRTYFQTGRIRKRILWFYFR